MKDNGTIYPAASGSYVGHDEGSNDAPSAPFLHSPAAHAPLQSAPSGLNVRTKFGETGIPEGGGE